jgi:DNA primase
MKEEQLLGLLEKTLGNFHLTQGKLGTEALFKCPSCNHHKNKLSINLQTQKYQCWVCGFKGGNIGKLFKLKKVPSNSYSELKEINKLYGFKTKLELNPEKTNTPKIQLPESFKPLFPYNPNITAAKKAWEYLIGERGLKSLDIIKYNIGYCTSGDFKNMIIFPSYSSEGELNYYVGRSFIKDSFISHRQPKGANKNIIGFGSHINWNLPVVICESPLDAISIKRNAIPLFGKKIHPVLMDKILNSQTKEIILALDPDALLNALKYADKILSNGKKVYIMDFGDKDANEIGFKNIINHFKQLTPISYADLIKKKLSII